MEKKIVVIEGLEFVVDDDASDDDIRAFIDANHWLAIGPEFVGDVEELRRRLLAES